MKLAKLQASHYRSLRDEVVELDGLNIFIGANASGKSTVLDALRFLHEGVQARDFRNPVHTRGGIINLCWKGETTVDASIAVEIQGAEDGASYEWSIRLVRQDGYDFHLEENVNRIRPQEAPVQLLDARNGEGWWWSGERGRVSLKQADTMCALAAAAADASFPARHVADFIERWGFFDPNPFLLRRDWTGLDSGRFDPYGRNLGETLHTLEQTSPGVFESIINATRDVLGLPSAIETREADDRFYFVQTEPGLQYTVHQMGVSSGTLRMLALMTALHAEPNANLIGIEEPENYVHPTALESFTEFIRNTSDRVQFMVTTHSPLLLDYLGDPSAVRIVQRNNEGATTVSQRTDGEGVRRALDESGFGLGAFYETKGFGAQ